MDKDKRIAKKPWSKPELLVLVRSNPEETVLAGCKVTGSPVQIKNSVQCSNNSCKGQVAS